MYDVPRLLRCIEMAMGCLDPEDRSADVRLAWFRLLDAKNGDEPRGTNWDENEVAKAREKFSKNSRVQS